MKKTIAAGQFKAKCLQLMDEVQSKRLTFVITKHGVPVAKLVPVGAGPVNLHGALKGIIKIKTDIIASIDDEPWEASS